MSTPARRDQKRIQYPWETLWTVILVGLLSGPENILALSQWLQGQRQVLTQHLALERIPQQAMIYRFFWALESHLTQLQTVLLSWAKAQHPKAHDQLVLLAGDGKTLKGSGREGQAALSFLSVFFHELALTVIQADQAGRHEAKGMGELLDTIQAVFGDQWLLTLDAAYTERGFTTQVVEAGGAYLVPLKNNVKDLKEWAVLAFSYPIQNGVVDVEYRSGEVWERRTDVLLDLPEAVIPEVISQALPEVKTLIRREHRVTRRDGSQTREVRYAVSSRLLTAREAEDIWRGHWGIENRSHQRRDTVLHEDRCRSRKGAQGKAMLHGVVLALLSSHSRHLTALVRQLRLDPLAALRLLRPQPS